MPGEPQHWTHPAVQGVDIIHEYTVARRRRSEPEQIRQSPDQWSDQTFLSEQEKPRSFSGA